MSSGSRQSQLGLLKFSSNIIKIYLCVNNKNKKEYALCKLVRLVPIYKLQMLVGSVTAW